MIQKRLFQPLTYFGDQKHARTRTHFYLVDVRKRSNELCVSICFRAQSADHVHTTR